MTYPGYSQQPPTNQPPPPPQPQNGPTELVIGSIVAGILAGWSVNRLMKLFEQIPGVDPAATRFLIAQLEFVRLVKLPDDLQDRADPANNQRVQNAYRRASYMTQAALRMTTALRTGDPGQVSKTWKRELVYMGQHLQAQARRNLAAKQVGAVWRAGGKPALLGWKAKMDARTTAECRQANGRNFDPRRIPTIGYPGTVHPHCRCVPTKAFDTPLRVEDLWVGMPPSNTVAASNPDYNRGDVWQVVKNHPLLPEGLTVAINLTRAENWGWQL